MRRAFAHGIVLVSLFSAAMALHAASLSRGGRNGRLNGPYGFAVHGTVESGTLQERNFVMSGIIEFDGQGGVTDFEATAAARLHSVVNWARPRSWREAKGI